MKHGRVGLFTKLRSVHLDTQLASYTLWFTCKRLNRKVKRALGRNRVRNGWLPQELIDYIVDYVSDDRSTLLACTHLSRAWCIAARAHLYRTFTVSNSLGVGAVDDLLKMGLIHLVRKVVVTRKFNQEDVLSPPTMASLHWFTHIQELDVRYLDVGALFLWLFEHCETLKSTVQSLTLRYPKGTIKQLVSLIGLFPNLENLTVESIDRIDGYDSQVPAMMFSPPLTGRLTLTGIFDPEFLSALTSMPKGFRFRTVDLRFCGEVQEIINACEGTMDRLIYYPSDYRDLKSLDLTRCESLRHAEISFHSISRAFPDDPFSDFLSSVPSAQLETCLIVSYDNDIEDLGRILGKSPKPKSRYAMEKEKVQPRRDVAITLGLDIEKEAVEDHLESMEEALDCAIVNGAFEFVYDYPFLEVYPRIWAPRA